MFRKQMFQKIFSQKLILKNDLNHGYVSIFVFFKLKNRNEFLKWMTNGVFSSFFGYSLRSEGGEVMKVTYTMVKEYSCKTILGKSSCPDMAYSVSTVE